MEACNKVIREEGRSFNTGKKEVSPFFPLAIEGSMPETGINKTLVFENANNASAKRCRQRGDNPRFLGLGYDAISLESNVRARNISRLWYHRCQGCFCKSARY